MHSLIKEYSDKISGKKAFWMPLLFYTFGAFGFSMLNRTVGVDDLATPLYADDTIWLQELRWGAVLWKKLFSFGANVPFLDKFLSVCFLMLAGTVFGCILYAINGRRQRVWLYTIAACSFITFPIIAEIWEYTCGGTLIVPGDFFCTFTVLLWLLTSLPGVSGFRSSDGPGADKAPAPAAGKTSSGRTSSGSAGKTGFPAFSLSTLLKKEYLLKAAVAGIFVTPLISSAESIAPVYIATVLIILFYRHCVRQAAPGSKTAWFWEGVYFAVPFIIAFVLRLVVGYGIMAVLHLQYKHTGATRVEWPLSGEELAALFKAVLIRYGVSALINLPITIFIVCTILFAVRCFRLAIKRRSPLPVFLGICIGASLFLITIVQGTVMYYRIAITLMVFCAFVFYLHAEDFYDWINDGTLHRNHRGRLLLGRCGIVLLLFITWRQAAHMHRYLALNNLRYDNEAAVMHEICYTLSTEYDTSKPLIFVGDFSNGDASYRATHDMGESWNGRLFRKIRHKIDGTETWKSPQLVQNTVASGIDFYHFEFDGQLMGEWLAYFGYDFDVIALSRDDLKPYNQEALDLGMKPFQILDRGDYLLVCLGRIE
ncbi:MAG: glucosyltransferase domain-containing protein [Lachnospiraceae bacterium]|nr:glucosyltransferase domain-containing protein [Lachnospiraceae bacterium]